MKTKWTEQTENRDGTGYKYYQCQCPQHGENGLDHLYGLCYAPKTNRLWFWDEMRNEFNSTRMVCTSWLDAENIKAMLTIGKSHWMLKYV